MKLHVFNPENDLALACYAPYFIPPQSARCMAEECAALPAWWADRGDAIRVQRMQETQEWATSLGFLCPPVEWVERAGALSLKAVVPWGWSPLLVQQLRNEGVDASLLLSEQQLDKVRALSHRRHAVGLLSHLTGSASPFFDTWKEWLCGASCYATDEHTVQYEVESGRKTILKAPWSGSGKGLRLGNGKYEPPLTGWCQRVIREQGGVVVEPLYNKVYDLAMEFYAGADGKVRYEGLSLFHTTSRGTYIGNRVMSEEKKRQWWASFLPEALFDDVVQALQKGLPGMLKGGYTGPLGVDMMLCREPGASRLLLHPCVEVNLRRTMGQVSVDLYRWVAPDVEALFMLEHFKDPAVLWADHLERMQKMPLCVESGRYVSGYLPLTPVTPGSHYRAMLVSAVTS